MKILKTLFLILFSFILSLSFSVAKDKKNLSSLNSFQVSNLEIKEKNTLLVAKSKKRKKKSRRISKKSRSLSSKISKKRRTKRRKSRLKPLISREIRELKALMKKGNFQVVSRKAFSMMTSSKFKSKKMKIRFILGKALYALNLKQAAAFQFTNIIKKGDTKLLKRSLQYLYLCADSLEDDTLLHYALSEITISNFPKNHRDLLYFRIGEIYIKNKILKKGINTLRRVSSKSPYFYKARYLQAMAYAEMNKNSKSLRIFNRLIDNRRSYGKNDPIRAAALIGRARVLYQDKKWKQAIQTYREVPKDTEVWHDSLLESSWTLLRSSKFRSALSPLHSLNSTFYENFYSPESLLLRSIIYLYICKYDELDKTLYLFQKIYGSLQKEIDRYLKDEKNPFIYFNDVIKALEDSQNNTLLPIKYPISPLLANKIYRDGSFYRSYTYIKNLLKEQRRAQNMPYKWRNSSVGKYTKKILSRRMSKSRKSSGKRIRKVMESINLELVTLSEQEGLIRYEMINSKKNFLQKKIKSKKKLKQIHFEKKRNFYIQNGFEYWPFRGEFWLDELGNYYYLGTSNCQ